MKANKLLKFIVAFSGILSLSSCDFFNKKNEEPEPSPEPTPSPSQEEVLTPVEIHNLYEGMVALYQTKNYTLNISKKEGTSAAKLSQLKFRDEYVGYDGDSLFDFNGTVNDGNGIYSVSYEEDFVTSEYLEKEDGTRARSLWDNSVISTMYGVGGQYIKKNVSPSISNITITDKNYIIGFVKTLGFGSTAFSSIDSLKAKFENGVTSFTLVITLSQTTTYTVSLADVGTTTSEHLKTFMKSESKVFTPSQDLQEMRHLIKLDNFIHQIYSISDGEGSYIGYEFFTPHYFMTSGNSDTNAGYVYMEVEHEPDETIDANMSGIYMFNIVKDGDEYVWQYSPNAINTTPDITKCMHYPSFLKLLSNLQYVKEGELRGSEYVFEGNQNVAKYYFTDESLVKDFGDNFSLTSQFTDCTPLAVSMELDLSHDLDKDKNVVFHYLMKYAGDGETYDVILPLMWFGSANKAHVDSLYETLNNKNSATN